MELRTEGRKRGLRQVLSAVIGRPAVWIPVLLLIAATVFFRLTNVDLAFSGRFFGGGSSGDLARNWPGRTAQPWTALYDWGVYPAWVLGCGGLAAWIASFFWNRLRSWRDPGLFFALVLAIGPGLIVNVVFKQHWGRPRPHNTVPFGGREAFLPVFQKGTDEEAASFPCGHASMGFYLMAPAFVFYRRKPRLAVAFLCLGLAAGIAIGMARIVEGDHFASDVLWSGGFVYFTGLALSAVFHFNRMDEHLPQMSKHIPIPSEDPGLAREEGNGEK